MIPCAVSARTVLTSHPSACITFFVTEPYNVTKYCKFLIFKRMNVKIHSSIRRSIRHREWPINVLSSPRKILKRRYLYYDHFSPLFDLYRIISLTIYAHYGNLVNVQSKLEDKTVLIPAPVISASLLAYRFEFIAVGLSCERVNASCDWK